MEGNSGSGWEKAVLPGLQHLQTRKVRRLASKVEERREVVPASIDDIVEKMSEIAERFAALYNRSTLENPSLVMEACAELGIDPQSLDISTLETLADWEANLERLYIDDDEEEGED